MLRKALLVRTTGTTTKQNQLISKTRRRTNRKSNNVVQPTVLSAGGRCVFPGETIRQRTHRGSVCRHGRAGSAKAAPSLFNIQPVAPSMKRLLLAEGHVPADAAPAGALRLLSTRAPACVALWGQLGRGCHSMAVNRVLCSPRAG